MSITLVDEWFNAVIHGDTATLDDLLSKDFDVNEVNSNGETGLIVAAIHGNLASASFLLSKQADIDAECAERTSTALSNAVYYERYEMAKLLLENGADANCFRYCELGGANGHAPALSIAAYNVNLGMVDLLLSYGHDLETTDIDGFSPFMTIMATNFNLGNDVKKIAERLIKDGCNINAKNNDGDTPIMNCIKSGYGIGVKFLLEHRAKLEIKNEQGETALMLAAMEERSDVVSLLLQNGAKINVTDKEGNTVLDHANDEIKALIHSHSEQKALDAMIAQDQQTKGLSF